MRPPPSHDAALPLGWPSGSARVSPPRRRLRGLRRPIGRKGLLALAATVMTAAMAVASYAALRPASHGAPGSRLTAAGTATLGTATCADWRRDGVGGRLAILRTLEVAATRPDPENPGATLARGDAYGLFQRVCSTPESRSALLYEAYNRAASFQFAGAHRAVFSSASGGP